MRSDHRGTYVTPYRKAVLAVLEDDELTHLDRLFVAWLVFAVDPGTRRISGVTITSLAELHNTGTKQIKATVERLRKAGLIEYRFERRTTGWVELVTYDRMMSWTSWMASQRQKAIAKKAQANRVAATRQRRLIASERRDSPGETHDSFLILLDDTPTPLADPHATPPTPPEDQT